MKKKSFQALEQEVYNFNEKYKTGDRVKVKFDNGEVKEVTVSHAATILGGHSAVGWFEEISGCYMLSRVQK